MKISGKNCLFCMALVTLFSCKKSGGQAQAIPAEAFSSTPRHITITGGAIPEASGIADSKANPGYLWVEEDSGNPPDIYLLGHDGSIAKTIGIAGAENRDWEDIALGPGPDEHKRYIYLADIGDNNLGNEECLFYRFEEPLITDDSVTSYSKILFRYPDGAHDAEAFLVDEKTKDIFVITKRDDHSKVYRLQYPQDTVEVNNAVLVSELPYNGVVSAAFSPDGREAIVKTYTMLYHYRRSDAATVQSMLAGTPDTLGYTLEPQGEAISFALDNSGFYTLSEMRNSIPVTLDFYSRN